MTGGSRGTPVLEQEFRSIDDLLSYFTMALVLVLFSGHENRDTLQ